MTGEFGETNILPREDPRVPVDVIVTRRLPVRFTKPLTIELDRREVDALLPCEHECQDWYYYDLGTHWNKCYRNDLRITRYARPAQ